MKQFLKYFGAILLLAAFAAPAFAADDDIIALSINREQVAKKLLDQLLTCDNAMKTQVAFALGEGKVEEAVEPLINMLDNGTEKCKIVAALALSRIGTDRASSAVRWAALKDDNPRVRTLAAWYYDQYVHPGSFEFVEVNSTGNNTGIASK